MAGDTVFEFRGPEPWTRCNAVFVEAANESDAKEAYAIAVGGGYEGIDEITAEERAWRTEEYKRANKPWRFTILHVRGADVRMIDFPAEPAVLR